MGMTRAFVQPAKESKMKSIVSAAFAAALLCATAANASVGVGVHVGGVGAGVHVGIHDHDGHHARRCHTWGWRNHHHDRYCRRWY